MSDDATLIRIAEALERLAPPPGVQSDLAAYPAYHWGPRGLTAVMRFRPLPLALLTGIDRQRDELTENTRRHAMGAAAHDVLLWGSRGAGKSALVKAVVGAVQDGEASPLALIEAGANALASLPDLFDRLDGSERRFILFLDDLAFAEGDGDARAARSMLEGGAEARPANVRLYVTSNRRAIMARSMAEQDDPINPRDVLDDQLALADRFGLKLGFQAIDQAGWLAMVAAYAAHYGLDWQAERDAQDALGFAHQRGGRSGRIAWHYVVELAGRAGRTVE